MTEKKGPPVYCNHAWDTFGPDTFRCLRCRTLWYKFKEPDEPKVVIGYIELPEG